MCALNTTLPLKRFSCGVRFGGPSLRDNNKSPRYLHLVVLEAMDGCIGGWRWRRQLQPQMLPDPLCPHPQQGHAKGPAHNCCGHMLGLFLQVTISRDMSTPRVEMKPPAKLTALSLYLYNAGHFLSTISFENDYIIIKTFGNKP